MKRNPAALEGKTFDLLVIGAGVHGAFTAREAALAGLSVALVDRADFCGATSANSLKIVHGGLRYLQQADVARLRASALARRHAMRIAPHLVRPLPSMMATTRRLMRSRAALGAAMVANDLLTADRNRGVNADRHIGRGRLISRDEFLSAVPGLQDPSVTGGAVWYDASAYDSERLVVEVVASAAAHGATAANYVEVTDLLRDGRRVTGARATDRLGGRTLEVRARTVVVNAGPWLGGLLAVPGAGTRAPRGRLCLAMNFVLKRDLVTRAAGLVTNAAVERRRLLFFMPWRGVTVAGTYYRPHDGPDAGIRVTDEDVAVFLADINGALPHAGLTADDIALVHAGLLPARPELRGPEPTPYRHAAVIDHGRQDGIEGLVSVQSVKYTTAWNTSRRVVDTVLRTLGQARRTADSGSIPLPGGAGCDEASLRRAVREGLGPAASEAQIGHILCSYGARAPQVLALAGGAEAGEPGVTPAQVRFAVREEMAVTLADTVFRRTGLGTAGLPSAEMLARCAAVMAAELGWQADRQAREVAAVKATRWPGGEPFAA